MSVSIRYRTIELMRKHETLDQSELEALLAWLAPVRDQAGQRYEAIRQTLTRYFERRHCVPADEHADETIDRVARRLRSGEQIRSADPYRYFHGVAKHVCQESLRQRLREARSHRGAVSMGDHASPGSMCLAYCLDTLPRDTRELLEAYYLGGRGDLAQHLGITPNALRLRVFKAKRKLKRSIAECLNLKQH
jgi:DNA-directed RNA polymerase specialized sigma24 family protein